MFWKFNYDPLYRIGAGPDWRVRKKVRAPFHRFRESKNLNWTMKDVRDLYLWIMAFSFVAYIIVYVIGPML